MTASIKQLDHEDVDLILKALRNHAKWCAEQADDNASTVASAYYDGIKAGVGFSISMIEEGLDK